MSAGPAAPPGRIVTLVLVTSEGEPVGALPAFPVETPWWADAASVVRAARQHHGVDVTVLRLLHADSVIAVGGHLTYLAEVTARPPAAEPWSGTLDEHPLRLSWARPGGPAGDLAWAEERLAGLGLRRVGPAEQIRGWNLSSLWRLPVEGQTAWLKVVPPFFAHEGAILSRLRGGPVPQLLAHEGARILMPEVPGDDQYDAAEPLLLEMVTLLVGLQAGWTSRVPELLSIGLPDWRPASLTRAVASVVERTADELTRDDRRVLASLVDGLAARFDAVAACGVPETLVHGDFHPGNVRGAAGQLVLLDWGDCGVGHPLLDQPAFLDRVPPEAVDRIREHWHGAWRSAVPGSDPDRAAQLLAPVAAARQSVIYRMFLDGIEPSEHPYHRSDPADWLHRAAELVGAER